MKKIGILGSTGSIGTQSLQIIAENPDRFQVAFLTCGHRTALLYEQIARFRPHLAVCLEEADALALQQQVRAAGLHTEILWGKEGLCTAAGSDCDMVLNALLGISGLAPTMAAIEAGHDLALANKETLVAGGALVMDAVARRGVKLLPVDSEHSAIFQCLEGNQERALGRILLTASGGPFRGYSLEMLQQVSLAQALQHPKWNMGRKITIDSATMMNKGLEVIEASWLFNVPATQIEILVHPQSIVHSMVEFADKAVLAQLGLPDMRIPISLALNYPDRLASARPSLDFFREGAALTFERPDPQVFRCIALAYEAARLGGSYPVVMNGANEVLVELFLAGKIRFIEIQENLERILTAHQKTDTLSLEGILEIDREVREYTYRVKGDL